MGAALKPKWLLQGCGPIDPDTCRVDIFRSGADDFGSLQDMRDGVAMDAAGAGCRVPVRDVFHGLRPADETGG